MFEQYEVEIDSLDLEGRGVGRHEGKVVFVDGALPGERVRIERLRAKPRYDTGRTVAVLSESALRVAPRCRHFGLQRGACGGCSMQHLEPRAQVAIKQRALEDTLWHVGRVRPEMVLRPIVGPAWHYRHRARMTVRYVAKKNGVLAGFHERASSHVADMHECHVLPARVSRMLSPLRAMLGELSIRDRLPQIELAVAARGRDEQIVLVLRVLLAPSEDDLARLRAFASEHGVRLWLQPGGPQTATPLSDADEDELLLDLPEFGVAIPFGPTDFTQVNHRINEVLVRRAVQLLEVQAGDRVIDFFCGLGNFTLPLATRVAHVVGIDGEAGLVRRAQQAAQRNGLAHRAGFEARNLFEWSDADWTRTVQALGGIEGVLIDPPREGALAIARVLVATTVRPRRVVYVSCNPATLARDAAVLIHEGGWRLRSAGVVNMFAHTSHVESIATFESEPLPAL